MKSIMGPAFDKELEAAAGADGRKLLNMINSM